MFSKVYFPRLVMPISNIIYNGVNFLIQFIIFVFLVIFYALTGSNVHPNLLVLLTPALLVMSAVLGSGCGLIISSLTAKYRDLSVLVSFCVTLWMYITPVVWPASQVSEGLRWIILINPVNAIKTSVANQRAAESDTLQFRGFFILAKLIAITIRDSS